MKKTNKGFSLVELIIVIAIMAILAGAIAPALIKYIDKSRKSNDVSAAKTFKTAIETALGTEEVYEILTNSTGDYTTVTLVPNKAISADADISVSKDYIKISGCKIPDGCEMTGDEVAYAIASNIGEKTPKTKYQKKINADGEKDDNGFKPSTFCAFITTGGTVYVCVTDGTTTPKMESKSGKVTFTGCAPLAPEVCKGYQ